MGLAVTKKPICLLEKHGKVSILGAAFLCNDRINNPIDVRLDGADLVKFRFASLVPKSI